MSAAGSRNCLISCCSRVLIGTSERRSSIPIFTDKHLAVTWEDAQWIYDTGKVRIVYIQTMTFYCKMMYGFLQMIMGVWHRSSV